ncbi:NAD(P)H-dependent oxidoreductase [Flammeovirga kamogawensis]|uniref:NAD(P)H-dependent oxidoreductase n=1 Tax=Flammeovirga kamogawensis TaxID=373891 RepID=A0ABX8GU73_9BACT|nr:NAD(P)H-dependent oxidoreductase [Flammeovirga kamogawensis]MBB6459789.1 modulator of drug activity B [Flammeovirga kamogawensis]QWG07153.1 NAD(P)H-dependent oxidoreductase [Flammeovirga kamogawensis]TRX68975.1 NAD(P)H-dependent oxidoreductase [Flammeovirga kamogawensis]
MKKILVINGAQKFLHSQGSLNKSITELSVNYFEKRDGFEVKFTNVDDEYFIEEEVEKFVWADVIIYHTPIWWFSIPFGFKKYIDEILTHGENKIYVSDGRHRVEPKLHYGTGGLLKGKKYFLTTSWNAPEEAFTLENEFFDQKSVDEGAMFGFHKMNSFIGLEKLGTYHFYDVMKDPKIEQDFKKYTALLDELL